MSYDRAVVVMLRVAIFACVVALAVVLCGCSSIRSGYGMVEKYIPRSPVTVTTGGFSLLRVLDVDIGVTLHNPFAESADETNEAVAADEPVPTIVDMGGSVDR